MIRRMFTFLLAIVFSFANVVFLHAAEANFWAERRKQFQDTLPKAEPMRLASLPSAPGALQTISNNLGSDAEVRDGVHSVLKSAANNNGWRRAGAGQTDPRLAALPLNQGRLVSYHPRPNKQAPLLALIQDVHLNTEAQGNIVQILSSLSGAHFKRTGRPIFVGVEAAFGPMDFSRLRAFDREAVAKPADEFLFSKNQLSAASFLGLQQEKEFAEFGGIDDKALYKRNVHAYLSSLKDRGDLKKILEEKKAENIRRKEEAFNPQLKEFDRFQRAHQSGAMDLGQYLTVLERFDPLLEDEVIGTGFELERFAQAYDLEKSLDFKRVERERNQVISLLAERLDQKDLEMLTARTMAFRSGGISYGDYFAGVKAMLASAGIRLDQTPAFDQYLRYLFLVDDLNAEALFASLAQKENALLKKLVRTPIEENLLEEGRAFLLTEKILDFALTPREWDEFRSLEQAGFAWADGRLKPFADFYVSADERSRVMADHLSERMKSRSADSAAVVVGGFHSPFLVRLMAERGVSTAVLQPNITKLEDGPGTVYLSVFSREKTPLDRLFKGEKLYLAPATLNIGQGAEVPAFINRAVISIEKNIPVPAEAGITVAADGGQINIIDSQNKFNAITLEQGEGDGAVETVFGVFHLKEGKARFGLDLLSFTVDALFHLIPAALLFLAPGLGLIPALAAGAVGFSALHLINKPASQNYTRRFLIQAGEAFAITAAGLFIAGFFSGEAFGQAAFNLASGDFFSLSSLVFLVAGTVLHAGFNPAAKAIPGLEPLNLNPPKKSLREILQPELWERLTALVKNSLPRGERWEDLNKENRTRLYGHVLPVFLEMYDKEVQAKADEGDYRLLKNKFSKIVFSAAEAYAVQEQEFAWLNEGVSFFDGASMTTRKSTPAEFAARMDTLNRILDGQIGAEDLRLSPEEALFELTGFQRRARRLQQAGQVTEVTLLVAPESQAADVLRVAQNSSQLTREKVDLLPPNLRQQGREQRAEFLLEESEDLSSSEKLDNAAEVYQLSAGSNDLKKDELRRRARALALEGLRGSRLSSEISDTSVAVFKNEDSSLGQRAAETKSAWRAAEHYLSSETVEDLDARVDDKQRALRFFRRELGIAAQFSAKEDSLRLTKAEQNLKKAREDGDLSGILNGLSEAKGLGPDDLLEIYLDVDRLINQAVASAGAVEDLAPLAALLEPWLNARRQSHPIEENLFPSWDPILDRVLDLAVWPEQINGFLHLFNGHRLHQEALLLRTIRPSAWKSSFENEFRQNPDLPLREIVRLIQREKTALLREIYRFGSIDDKGDLTASSTLEKDGDLIAGALKDWGSFLDRLKRENLTRVFGPSAEEERIAAFWNWQLVRWGAYNRFKQMLGRVLVDVDVWFSDIEEAFNDSSLEGDEKQENLQLAVVRVLNRIVKKDGKKKPESVHYNLKNKEG